LRARWKRFRDLTPDQKQRLRDVFKRYQSLTARQREALRKRWYQMTPAERQRAIDRRQPTAPTAPRQP